MTLDDLLTTATERLKAAGIETARLDARLLVERALGVSPEYILAHGQDVLPDDSARKLEPIVSRRVAREPMAHILGIKEFWSLDFMVGPQVLSPRPDSETLVSAVLDAIADKHAPLKILDLGTGSGCLLLAILSEIPNALGWGIDQSVGAIEIAKQNSVRLGLQDRSTFAMSPWADWQTGPFDIVISNPPYISTNDIPGLQPEVRDFEPYMALDGGVDGLDCYRDIAIHLPRFLSESGFAVLEFGMGQGSAVAKVFGKDPLEVIDIKRDLAGLDRVVTVRCTTG